MKKIWLFPILKLKKTAFTLIELMAVVIILGIVTTITVTSINYNIRMAKQKLYAEQITRLQTGVENWASNNTDLLPTGVGIAFFDVARLKDEGIIDAELVKDPRNDGELTGCMVIRYDGDFSQYTYTYEDKDCTEVEGTYLPTVTITNGTSQFAEVNDVFEFPEVKAVTYAGNTVEAVGPIIKKNGVVVTRLDTSIVDDVYTLEYEATDPVLGLTATEVVTVTVNDTIAPVIVIDNITIPASYSIIFEANTNFSIPNSQISDNSCGASGIDTSVNDCDITLEAHVEGTIISNIPDTYNITYEATDKSGNTKYLILSVTVQDTIAPTAPTLIQYKLNNSSGATYSNTWTNNNVWVGNITSTDNGSGVEYYSYQLNCTGGWTNLAPGVTSFTITGEMNSNVCIKSYDYMSNGSATTTSGLIRIDKTAPSCASSGGSATWTSGTRTILGTCTDTTGVVNSGCSGANPSYTYNVQTNITNGGPGTGGATASVSDQAGNSATCPANQTVKIDRTAPVISIGATSNPYQITVGSAFVEPGYTATDNSGLTPTVTTTTIPTASGTYTITYTATDSVGYTATATRAFYIWTAWSAWSTTVETATATKEVQTKTQYRYSDYVVTSTTYKSCSNSACGIASTVYNTCVTAACGIASTVYNFCRTSACGCETLAFCQRGSTTGCVSGTIQHCCLDGECRASSFTCAGGGASSVWCRHTSCGCTTYNSCRASACGVSYYNYNSCAHTDCGVNYYNYNSCRTAACGIESQTFDWNAWSAWQDAAVTASGTRQVQTQTLYSTRTR